MFRNLSIRMNGLRISAMTRRRRRDQAVPLLAVLTLTVLGLGPARPVAAQVGCGDTITANLTLSADLDCTGFIGAVLTVGANGDGDPPVLSEAGVAPVRRHRGVPVATSRPVLARHGALQEDLAHVGHECLGLRNIDKRAKAGPRAPVERRAYRHHRCYAANGVWMVHHRQAR